MPNNFQKDSMDTAADAQGWILNGTKGVILPTQKKKTRRADGGRLERHERIRFNSGNERQYDGHSTTVRETSQCDQ